jgi:hypothetical protein
MTTYSIKRRNFISLVRGLTALNTSSLGSRDFSYIRNKLVEERHMPHSTVYTMSRCASGIIFGAWLAVGVPAAAAANVITDWDEKAIAVVFPAGPVAVSQQVYTAQRMMGMVHVAMFDAVNSIERRYRPYLVQLPADPAT